MPFFGGGSSGGSGSGSIDPRLGKYPYYISATASIPQGAQIAEFVADLNCYDSSGYPLDVDGDNLSSWKSLNDGFELTPVSGSTIQLKEDSDGYRYLDCTGSADGLEITTNLLSGRDQPFAFLIVCEPQSLAADDTFIYGWDTSSANDTVELKLNSSLELQSVLTNEYGTDKVIDGVYGGEAVFSDQTKTILMLGHTGEKVFFGSGQTLGAFRFANMADSDNGGARVINKLSIGCRGTGTPDRFAQLKIYQVVLMSGNLFRATGHINALSIAHGVALSKPSTKVAPIPSHAWWPADNSSSHPDVRGSGYNFATSGSLGDEDSDITISDTAVTSFSGGYMTMATPPPSLLGTTDNVITLALRVRMASSFASTQGIAGLSDGSSNRHWEITINSSGIVTLGAWDSVGQKTTAPSITMPTSKYVWIWACIDKVDDEISLAFDDDVWNSATALGSTLPSISSAALMVLKATPSGTAFAGAVHSFWVYVGTKLTQEQRQLVMGNSGYWHGGHPGEAVPII